MKKIVCAIALLALAIGGPALAQGPFTDVPTDHWAYDAVEQLVSDGIIVGYPDGTFGGKRAMTRFEFAQALQRAIPIIVEKVPPSMIPPAAEVTKADIDALKGDIAALKAAPKPEVSKADLDAIRKMAEEFKDELTAIGVDVDGLKRDVADLNKRLTAVEDEQKRLRITGELSVAGVFDKTRGGSVVDRDDRGLNSDEDLLENITLLRQLDLRIDANAGSAKVHALLNIGNYLPVLETISDYVGGTRPTSSDDMYGSTDQDGDQFYPYYVYADIPMGSSTLTVGRFPIQWSPYTLKMIDVDSYVIDSKTDSGDYPLDGISLTTKLGGIGLQLFASKVNTNSALIYWESYPGLVSQADAGLGALNDQGDTGFGGLSDISQVAGAQLSLNLGKSAKLTGSYLRASEDGTTEQAELIGAGLMAEIGKLAIGGEWAQTTLTDSTTLDENNTALDANVGLNIGALGLKGGWKSIGYNFTAPGFWDKLGRWTNPSNIEGPYVNLKWGLGSNLSLCAGAEFLSGRDDYGALPGVIDEKDDNVKYYTAGLKWGVSSATALDLGLEWVRWEPNGDEVTDEKYITIGLGHQFSPNVMAKIGYQIIDMDSEGGTTPYGADYKGDIAVAQFMIKF